MVIYSGQVRQNDDCSSSLFNLKNVRQHLLNVLVIEHKENYCSLLIFIKHRKWSVSKFCTWVRLSMNASDLAEFLSDEVGNEMAETLGKQENIILPFQKLGDGLVFCQVGWLKGLLHSQTEIADVLDQLLALVLDERSLLRALNRLVLLLVGEPDGDESQAYDLRDEALDVAVAMARLLVESDVLVDNLFLAVLITRVEKDVLTGRALFLYHEVLVTNLVNKFSDWGVFHINDVEASQILFISHFHSPDDVFVFTRLSDREETTVLHVDKVLVVNLI